MDKVLYYPSFFIEDEKWLKFALLYLGEVVTIKPKEVNVESNSTVALIREETDLFSTQAPSQEEIDYVAVEYGEFIRRVLENPVLQKEPSNLMNRRNMNYEIYSGKMSWRLEQVLLENGLAEHSANGVIVNKDLALEYMALLANILASNRSMPTITDKKMPVKYAALNRVINREAEGAYSTKTLVNQMEIFLPQNINHITIDEIVDFRNKPGNREGLIELHKALNKFNSLNELSSERDMLNAKIELFEMKKQYVSRLASTFTLGAGSLLGMYQLYQGDSSYIDYIREVLGIDVIGGIRYTYGDLNNYLGVRKATSYISDIENLGRRRSIRH